VPPRTARAIRDQIGGKGRYPPVRSWDCVALLRLDDCTLEHLAVVTSQCVATAMSVPAMAKLLPTISRYQLRLFVNAFFPERRVVAAMASGQPIGAHAGLRSRLLDPGPAKCQIAYVMRTQGVTERQAIAFIRNPAAYERRAS
jgi:hypothetical protein